MNKAIDAAELARKIPFPVAPRSPQETGLSDNFLLDLMMKMMVRKGCERASELSRLMCLRARIVDQLLEMAKDRGLVESLGQALGSFHAELRYGLTARGRHWAAEALAQCEWTGPTPVPLRAFLKQAEAQSVRQETLTRARLEQVFHQLTLSEDLMRKMGPAANSGASILLYGPPGNGKSSIAEALCRGYGDVVYLPHAIEVDGQVVTLYDPSVHRPVDGDPTEGEGEGLRRRDELDGRYIACMRPAVVAGGELSLDMLDLSYSPSSRVYEAPMQLKATGGIFVVDDFGRQRQTPQEYVNRLIIPLEKRVDYLTLDSGRKFETPFDMLMVFSTNTAPQQLLDEAGLRRMRHKILVGQPDRHAFVRIFARAAEANGLRLTEEVLAFVLVDLYGQHPEIGFHAYHPKFLIEQAIAICLYEGIEPNLSAETMRRAWEQLLATAPDYKG